VFLIRRFTVKKEWSLSVIGGKWKMNYLVAFGESRYQTEKTTCSDLYKRDCTLFLRICGEGGPVIIS
jgi:hypothetical protein